VLSFVFPLQNSQFTEVEDNIMGRMGAMGKRMDDLERSELDLCWILDLSRIKKLSTHLHLHLLVYYHRMYLFQVSRT
jgi:hypothetical protein